MSSGASIPTHRKTVPGWLIVVLALLVFATLATLAAVYSGGFSEADGISHYLKRRHALENKFYLVDIWARPLCVWVYAVPAHFFGLIGVRLTSLVLAIGIALITWSIAKRLKLALPELVVVLLCGQPMFFIHACAELTELMFALLLVGMFWSYQRKQWLLLAALAALTPLARPEGFGLLAIVGAALLLHRRWWWLPVLIVGLAGWSYAGWRIFGGPIEYPWWKWLIFNWPFSAESAYGSGSVLAFVAPLPVLVGPFATPFVWAGAWKMVRGRSLPLLPGEGRGEGDRREPENLDEVPAQMPGLPARGERRSFFNDHEIRCRLLVPTIAIGLLIAHTFLWMRGWMASAGMIRYLVTVAPFWAILALVGWNAFCSFWPVTRVRTWLIVGVLAIVPVHAKFSIYPIRVQGMQVLAEKTADWIRGHPELVDRAKYPRLMTSLPSLFYAMDVDENNPAKAVPWGRKQVEQPEAGTLLVFEAETGSYNANASSIVPRRLLDEHHWKLVGTIEHSELIWTSPKTRINRVYKAEVFLCPSVSGE
ncbi:MAG: hypothetical protein QM770_23890 [Tepidisphaeraceae bacterium]